MESRRFAEAPEAAAIARAVVASDRLREIVIAGTFLFYFRAGLGGPFIVLGIAFCALLTLRLLSHVPGHPSFLPEHWRLAASGLVFADMASFGLPFTGNWAVLWVCLFTAPWCMILFTFNLLNHWRIMVN